MEKLVMGKGNKEFKPLNSYQKYRLKNLEKYKKYQKEYRERNREKLRQYYWENKERLSERKKIWNKENRDKLRLYQQRYLEKNPDKKSYPKAKLRVYRGKIWSFEFERDILGIEEKKRGKS